MSEITAYSNCKILAVDDSRENLTLLMDQLSYAGYRRVVVATSGAEALEKVTAESPDLILLDVMMPEMDGYQVTHRIREAHPDVFIPIILVSALQSAEERVRGLHSGANDFLSRPYHVEELVARVEALLTIKTARDQLSAQHNRLALLFTVTNALASHLDPRDLLAEIVVQTTNAICAERAFLVFLEGNDYLFQKIQMRRGESPVFVDKIDLTVPLEQLVGEVIQRQKGVLVLDLGADSHPTRSPGAQEAGGAALAAPLTPYGQAIGVLLLANSEPESFSEDHLDLLTAVAAQATIALENAHLFEDARRQRNRMEAILGCTADSVVVTDERGIITRINPAACETFDLDETILGRPLNEIFHISITDLLVRSQERGEPVSGEYSIRNEQREVQKALSLSVSPISNAGYVLVAHDITPLKEVERFRLENERAEVQRILDTLSRYMSESLVERALKDRTFLERRERREAVILFADLRGFTRLTGNHPPDKVVDLLDEFFTEMIDIVHKHEGIILGFAGDEIMVGFNLPYDQPDANHRALRTAAEMQRRFAELQQTWSEQGMMVGLGIGVSRGMVIIGNVGGPTRMDYTTVGQTVNMAHRLVEGAEDGQIIASVEMLAEGLPPVEGIHARELPPFQVKGRDEPLPAVLLELGSEHPT